MTARWHLAALLGLERLGPARLDVLVERFGDPEAAWHAIVEGRVGDLPLRAGSKQVELVARWRAQAATVDIAALEAAHREAGITMLLPDDARWPPAFLDDPDPPRLLFVLGDAALLVAPSVAIVGTRRCTAGGAATARELGHDLAAAGISIVSGLALGIDGAAHQGALRAGGLVVGIVATGLDVVYPRRHRQLWDDVARAGAIASEAPLGTAAERWRFPARNRLIAALASAVVVVESRATGGSMLTVESAIERDTEVLAVPGPVRAPTSHGPNQLLADGCGIVRDATDVLVALGSRVPVGRASPGSSVEADDPVARAVSWPPSSLDDIVLATGLSFATVAARLAELELDGVVERVATGYQRTVR